MKFNRIIQNMAFAALTVTALTACEGDVFNIDADPFKGKRQPHIRRPHHRTPP